MTENQLSELKRAHRSQRDKHVADRIKAVIALSNGRSPALIAEMLLIDEKTVRNYYERFCDGGIDALSNDKYSGATPKLSVDQTQSLMRYLDENIITSSNEIRHYIIREYGVRYSISGLIDLLHRLDYSYKKPKHVPGKQDPEAQRDFIEKYYRLKAEKGENDVILFGDATHPQHNSAPAYGWIKKGVEKELKSNCGRQRLNINGVIDIETCDSTIGFYDTINAQSTIELFRRIEAKYGQSDTINIIVDNARYYRSRMLQIYLSTSRIKLIFLPPYSPNLNIIERYWKLFKKKVINNKYYASFRDFIKECKCFFRKRCLYLTELKTLLTENFHIIAS